MTGAGKGERSGTLGGWRISHGVMAALLAWSVAWQFNDEDPAPWILLYGACAVVAGLGVGMALVAVTGGKRTGGKKE